MRLQRSCKNVACSCAATLRQRDNLSHKSHRPPKSAVVAKLSSRHRTAPESCCYRFEGHYALIFYWVQAVYPLWWPCLTEELGTESKKCFALVRMDRCEGSYARTGQRQTLTTGRSTHFSLH